MRVRLLLEVDGDDDDLWPDDDEPLQPPAAAALHAAILGILPTETLDDKTHGNKQKIRLKIKFNMIYYGINTN